jgi:hypothetical protein
MTVIISGDNGVSDVDGSAGTPAIRGTDANTGIFFPAADTIAFAEGGAEAMRIDSSGRVGIGTTSPSARLDVAGSASGAYVGQIMRNTDAGGYAQQIFQIGTSGGTANINYAPGIFFSIGPSANDTTTPIVFQNNNATERARITSTGAFQTPETATGGHLFGVDRNNGTVMSMINATSTSPYGLSVFFRNATPNNTNSYFISCTDSTNDKCTIFSSGTITNRTGTYNSFSDLKLKQDITDASSQWNDIKALRVVKYRLKDEVLADPNYPAYIGLIAQEAEQVSPGLVDDCPDFEEVEVTDEEGNVTTERQATGTVTKAVKYSILYMKAVKALQEAMERIETLEAKVAALEAR